MTDPKPSNPDRSDPAARSVKSEITQKSIADDVMPFRDFSAPTPIASEPPPTARWLAFAGIILGGLLGGLIGYGTADLLGAQPWLSALSAIALAAGAAIGVGIVAQLTLRAMNEWNAVQHPEDQRTNDRNKST